MKRILLLLFCFYCFGVCHSQSKELKQKYQSYLESGYFKIDNKEIVVSGIIENVPGSKEDIYIKIKNFFARRYKDSNSVLQTDDKEAGTIIGKGYFRDLKAWTMLGVNPMSFSAYHILRVDIKEGRVRVLCSASTWEYDSKDSPTRQYRIVEYSPVTNERIIDKGKQAEAFINLVELMHETIKEVEQALTDGLIKGENEDW